MIARAATFDGVDLWFVALDETFDSSSLSADELARTRGCLDPAHAHRLRASRVGLRAVLASYLDVRPANLAFSRTSAGAPVLVEHPERCFSLSRSRHLAVVAVSVGRRVGVDMQGAPPDTPSCDALARHVLDAEERRIFWTLDADGRRQTFLAAWTRREAAVKAMNVGLFDRRAPSPDETGESALVSSGWQLMRPRLVPDQTIALVFEALDGSESVPRNGRWEKQGWHKLDTRVAPADTPFGLP